MFYGKYDLCFLEDTVMLHVNQGSHILLIISPFLPQMMQA